MRSTASAIAPPTSAERNFSAMILAFHATPVVPITNEQYLRLYQ